MIQVEIPRELTEEVIASPGGVTRAEVDALLHIYRGESIPQVVQEAVLLTANNRNRDFLQQNLSAWEKTTGSFPPEKAKVFGKFALPNLTDAIAMNAGDKTHLELRKINLAIAFKNEGLKSL